MNKKFTLTAGALIGLAAFAAPALAGVDVSISLGQPNFYGVIDMGGAPPPRVIYSQPRVVEQVSAEQEPIYLHVRPGQARHWKRYCGEYDACGRRVYFVRDSWYNTTYVNHYRHHHDEGGHGHGHGNDYNGRDDRRDGEHVEDGHGGHYDNGQHRGHGNDRHGN